VVRDPQTHTQTHKQSHKPTDRTTGLQYTAPQLASAQCKNTQEDREMAVNYVQSE